MSKAAARTGPGPTVMVGVEQRFPARRRLLDDPWAAAILPLPLRAFVALTRIPVIRDWMVRATERAVPGLWAGMMGRKRFIDEKLLASVGDGAAVVNLGAGFDTRALRLPLGDTPVWEVDQAVNIRAKRKRLRALFGGVPARMALVETDFDRDDLGRRLAGEGYHPGRPTFFIWEAVTQYLTEAGVRSTLDFLATAAPGSRLAFTYIRQDFLDGGERFGQDALHRKYVANGGIWSFGLDPARVGDFLEPFGWRLVEHPAPEDLARRYVAPTGRDLAAFPVERVAIAEKLSRRASRARP